MEHHIGFEPILQDWKSRVLSHWTLMTHKTKGNGSPYTRCLYGMEQPCSHQLLELYTTPISLVQLREWELNSRSLAYETKWANQQPSRDMGQSRNQTNEYISRSPTNNSLYFLAIMFPIGDNHNISFQELRTSESDCSSTVGEIWTLTPFRTPRSKLSKSTNSNTTA